LDVSSCDAAAATARWCQARTSTKVGRTKDTGTEAGRIEFDLLETRLIQQVSYSRATANHPAVVIMALQDVGRFTSVSDDHRPLVGRALGTADILIERAARNFGDDNASPW